jgi:hypothetical protein
MPKIAIAVHACGFKSEDKICKAFESRLIRVYEIACWLYAKRYDFGGYKPFVIITGGVSYRAGSTLLARLGGDYLEKILPPGAVLAYRIFYATDCYNSSTDTQNVLRICQKQGVEKLIVVTSYWHNWMVRQMYRRFNTQPDLIVEFARPTSRDGAGLKTIIKYTVFGSLVLASRMTGQFERLDNFLNRRQRIRQEGFQEAGCN